ncbi:3754_t:CDS:2 [Entrophospora sp. SA101]|nr:3754_t:CDS:2 [Entrophospora sp. SA101]
MELENTPIMRETGDKKVYLFIDNSNLFIEGKYSVGHHEIGSKPPSEDSMWKYIRGLGFDVTVYKRNSQDREKKVDVTLACAMQKTIDKNTPGVLVLIAGDGDYEFPIIDAIKNNWIVEVWFWKSGENTNFTKLFYLPALKSFLPSQLKYTQNNLFPIATSNDFQKKDFRQLDCHYKIFTYGDEHTPNEKVYTLELINEKLEKWTNIEAMQCFIKFGLFSRLKWINSTTLYLHFKEREHMDKAKQWIKEHYELEANEII